MEIRIPKFNTRDILFFLSFSLYMFFSILQISCFAVYFLGINKFLMPLCIVLLLLYEMCNSTMNKRELLGAGLLYFLALWVIWRGGRSQSLAIVFLYAFSARNIAFTKIAKVSLIVSSLLLFIILSCSKLGIIPDYTNIRYTLTGIQTRHYLGFLYVLFGPAIFLNAILLYIYIRKEKIKLAEISAILLLSIWMFSATNARLSFLLSILCVMLAIVNKYRKDNYSSLKVIPRMLISSYIACFAIIFLLTIHYSPSNQWMLFLDFLLANRLSLSQISIKDYGINLFGSKVEWIGNGLDAFGKTKVGEYAYLWVDSLYIQILQRDGVIFTAIFLFIMTLLMYKLYKRRENLLLIILSVRAVQCMIDSTMQSLRYNTFFLLIGIVFFGYLSKKKIKPDEKSIMLNASE